MLTKRPLLLTALALLSGFAATAQPTAPAGPGPADILSWIAGALAVLVVIMGLMTGLSVAATAGAALADAPAAEPAAAPAPVAAPAPAEVAAPAAVFTPEPVAA